ncbi:hypothetical protein MAH1_33900 [Sessilibacter sp. MAH1]
MPTLQGTLLLPNGTPLANANIILIADRNEGANIVKGVSSEFSTNASGVYSQLVEPGLYSVKLEHQQRTRTLGKIFIDPTTNSSLEVLLVASDDAETVTVTALQTFLSDTQAAADSAAQSADDAINALAENQAQLDAFIEQAQSDVNTAVSNAESATGNAIAAVEGLSGVWSRLNNYVASYFQKSQLTNRGPNLTLVAGTAPAGRTYIDRYGIQRVLSDNQLGESEFGWVINSESENLLNYSSGFSANWSHNNISANQSTELGLNNSSTMVAVVPNTVNGSHYISSFFQTVAGQSYTFSVAVKPGDFDQIRLTVGGAVFNNGLRPSTLFEFSTKTATQFNDIDASSLLGPFHNGIYILTVSFTPDISAPVNVFVYAVVGGIDNFIGNNTDKFYIDQAQLEPVPFFTGFIPTNGAPVARPATRFSRVDLIDLSRPFSIYCKYNYLGQALDFEHLISTDDSSFIVGTNHLQSNGLVIRYNGQFFSQVPNAYGRYEILFVFDGANFIVYDRSGNLLISTPVNSVLPRGIESLRFFSGSASRLTGDCEAAGVTVWDFALTADDAKLLLGSLNG